MYRSVGIRSAGKDVTLDMTEKLFYEDSHLAEFEAKVIACRREGDRFWIELNRTAFFPEGGGQYADTGMLENVRVLDVQEEGGHIFHIAEEPLESGASVHGKIDWEERFMKMQQHTGEHIVSGLVHARFGYNNVGFHLGNENCTMDFSGEITRKELDEIELEANRAVWKNLEVQSIYPSEEELAHIKYRSKIEIEGQVRIIVIPGYDVCACCAPHVSRTGEIGAIKLINMQRYKGGVRVTMLCGVRALADYAVKQKQAELVSSMLCAKIDEISDAVSRLREENATLKYTVTEKERQLAGSCADAVPQGEEAVCMFPEGVEGDSLRLIMNRVLDGGHCVCAVFHGDDRNGYRYVIGSRNKDMRALVKEFNAAFHGRGGGKAEMVQGTAAGNREEIRKWILEKAGDL